MMEKQAVEGRVAFVTGGGQGIGRGIAERLHADGFKVAVADYNDVTAAEVAKSLGGKEGGAIAVHVDVADRDSVFRAIDETVVAFGDLHVVLNNAGIAPMTPIGSVSTEEFERLTAINFGGVLWGIQAGAAAFERLGHGGKILSASSQAGHIGNPGIAVYSGTKFAVRGLTQAAARELAPKGITVNAWCPGIVQTPMLESVVGDTAKEAGESYEWALEQWSKNIALGRLSVPADVAGLVSFLAGPDSDYLTGQSILVDGGMAYA